METYVQLLISHIAQKLLLKFTKSCEAGQIKSSNTTRVSDLDLYLHLLISILPSFIGSHAMQAMQQFLFLLRETMNFWLELYK